MAAVTEPPTGRRTEPGTRKIPEPITVPMTRSTRSRIRRTCRSSSFGLDTADATSVVVLVSLGIDVSFDIAIWLAVVDAPFSGPATSTQYQFLATQPGPRR